MRVHESGNLVLREDAPLSDRIRERLVGRHRVCRHVRLLFEIGHVTGIIADAPWQRGLGHSPSQETESSSDREPTAISASAMPFRHETNRDATGADR